MNQIKKFNVMVFAFFLINLIFPIRNKLSFQNFLLLHKIEKSNFPPICNELLVFSISHNIENSSYADLQC